MDEAVVWIESATGALARHVRSDDPFVAGALGAVDPVARRGLGVAATAAHAAQAARPRDGVPAADRERRARAGRRPCSSASSPRARCRCTNAPAPSRSSRERCYLDQAARAGGGALRAARPPRRGRALLPERGRSGARRARAAARLGAEREAAELFERARRAASAPRELHQRARRRRERVRACSRARAWASRPRRRCSRRADASRAVLKRAAELYESAPSCGSRRRAATPRPAMPRRAARALRAGRPPRAGRASATRTRASSSAPRTATRGGPARARRAPLRARGRPHARRASSRSRKATTSTAAARSTRSAPTSARIDTLQRVAPGARDARPAHAAAGADLPREGPDRPRAREALQALAVEPGYREGRPRAPAHARRRRSSASATRRARSRRSSASRAVDAEYARRRGAARAPARARLNAVTSPTLAPTANRAATSCATRSAAAAWASCDLAWDRELERPVAIKFLPNELAANPAGACKMFRDEARAAAAMNHPNIVHIYDVAVVNDQPCIVMEYVQGRTVREVMRVRGSAEKAAAAAAARGGDRPRDLPRARLRAPPERDPPRREAVEHPARHRRHARS